MKTLADLDITPKYRKDVILKLKAIDYSEGPLADLLNHMGDMWVFGKDVKGKEGPKGDCPWQADAAA